MNAILSRSLPRTSKSTLRDARKSTSGYEIKVQLFLTVSSLYDTLTNSRRSTIHLQTSMDDYVYRWVLSNVSTTTFTLNPLPYQTIKHLSNNASRAPNDCARLLRGNMRTDSSTFCPNRGSLGHLFSNFTFRLHHFRQPTKRESSLKTTSRSNTS